jgi:hypothetical protein
VRRVHELAAYTLCVGGGHGGRACVLERWRIGATPDHWLLSVQYQHHVEAMDPESTPTLPLAYTNQRHGELDLDGDSQVTVEELCIALEVCTKEETEPKRFREILASNLTEPVQIHLAATSTFDEMIVNWAQNITDSGNSEVQYGTTSGAYAMVAPASWKTYTVEQDGLTYTSLPLFNATMTRLQANTRYYYIVGSTTDGFSAEYSFVSLPDPSIPAEQQPTTRMLAYGDQGTTIPMGTTVCKWIEAENAVNPFGMTLHVGDLAYAGQSRISTVCAVRPVVSHLRPSMSTCTHRCLWCCLLQACLV